MAQTKNEINEDQEQYVDKVEAVMPHFLRNRSEWQFNAPDQEEGECVYDDGTVHYTHNGIRFCFHFGQDTTWDKEGDGRKAEQYVKNWMAWTIRNLEGGEE